MADVVYFHVGAPKTGTTYLQERLHANRASLAEHGVTYPTGLHRDMFPAALDLIDVRWQGQREDARGEWDHLVGRIKRASGQVLVTHEIFSGATPDQVAKVRQDLSFADFHLVYSQRDVARQVPAEWQESLKHRHQKTFKEYLGQVMESREDTDLWFWRCHHLPDVLGRWAAGMPADRVHLVTLPQAGAPRDTLWLRYCTALGIDPAAAPEDTGRANSSIGIDETRMLRELNRRLRKARMRSKDYRPLVRQRIVNEGLSQRPGMRRATIPPSAYDWAREVAEEWISYVEASGIHVVGAVDELRPVLPEITRAEWQNPDRAKPRDLAEVTMDALVIALQEAARRPDPDRRPVARLGRAARRVAGRS